MWLITDRIQVGFGDVSGFLKTKTIRAWREHLRSRIFLMVEFDVKINQISEPESALMYALHCYINEAVFRTCYVM